MINSMLPLVMFLVFVFTGVGVLISTIPSVNQALNHSRACEDACLNAGWPHYNHYNNKCVCYNQLSAKKLWENKK